MTITREQFGDSYDWDDWLAAVRARPETWRERHDDATLGELRDDYQRVPTPRSVLCIVEDDGIDSIGTVPYIVRACEQVGTAAGIAVRLARRDERSGLIEQYRVDGEARAPICVVFDDDWLQVGVWGPRPQAAERAMREIAAADAPDPAGGPEARRTADARLDEWYAADAGRSTLSEFVRELRGRPNRPWRAGHERSRRLWRQVQRARDRRRGR